MRVIMKQFFERLSLILFLLGVLLIGGAFLFSHLEGWTWIQGFYFSTMTVTTVGYGDFVPGTDPGRLVASIYALVTIPFVFFCIGIMGEVVFAHYHDKIQARRKKDKRRRR